MNVNKKYKKHILSECKLWSYERTPHTQKKIENSCIGQMQQNHRSDVVCVVLVQIKTYSEIHSGDDSERLTTVNHHKALWLLIAMVQFGILLSSHIRWFFKFKFHGKIAKQKC